MVPSKVRIGQMVTAEAFPGRTFVVLDRHPSPACWWLQDAETGEISFFLMAHARTLTLVARLAAAVLRTAVA